ncbi:MAG: GtrA family protein [Pseudomonadota bacterium]
MKSRIEFIRYFGVSLIALLVDLGLFSLCLRVLDISWPYAASIGFVGGVVTAYILSVRFVFHHRTMAPAPAAEFLVFTVIGVVGLGVTQLVLWLCIDLGGLQPEFSKLVAAGVTFVFNFAVRKVLLFASLPIQKKEWV